MIGYWNYTVILTYIGTVCGFTGITFADAGDMKAALICLMLAGFCDMFDGKIASTMKRTPAEKRFGIQIDSLSDVICFGVLPAAIVFFGSSRNVIYVIPSAIYMLCALIRLAWFNVDEEERQSKEGGSRKVYLGLPVTASAVLVPFFIGLFSTFKLAFENIYPWLILAIGAAFLTPFHMSKPGTVGKIIMIAIGVCCLVLVLIGL